MADEDSTIDGYQVVSDIAGSNSSHVLEVIEPGTQRHLAMKLLNKEHPDFKEHKATLKREAQICKLLDHPNIIKYVGFSAGRDHTYMVMDYFRAPNLKLQIKNDRLGVHLRLKKLLDGLCAALQHIHDKGYIHRDIKPENVLVNKAGEVRLIDFSLAVRKKEGLSKLFGGKPQSIQGTRTYIAPETIRKRQPCVQTDLYSLGVLIFEMLTGRTVFQAPTPDELLQKHLTTEPPLPSEFNKNVSPEMDRLVTKLLSKKPDARGKDVTEISGELRRIRFFIEEPQEKRQDEGGAQKTSDLLTQLTSGVIDSRADATWSEMVRERPELASEMVAKKDERKKDKEAEKKRREAALAKSQAREAAKAGHAPAAPIAPAQQAAPPMMMPGPMYPPAYGPGPGMPMPMGQPAGYPPGMMPPGMPPGYPSGPMMPGMPMMPPQQVPPGMPGMPTMPTTSAPPPRPAAPAAAAPPARPAAPPPVAAPRPTPATPAVPDDVNLDELDYMTELPEIR